MKKGAEEIILLKLTRLSCMIMKVHNWHVLSGTTFVDTHTANVLILENLISNPSAITKKDLEWANTEYRYYIGIVRQHNIEL